MDGILRVVGAGLPRTGTRSLQVALQQLLGAGCYHMHVLFERGNVDVPAFRAALAGQQVDWPTVFAGCAAAVGWPASLFWRELAERNPADQHHRGVEGPPGELTDGPSDIGRQT